MTERVPPPRRPLVPEKFALEPGTLLYRVHWNGLTPTEFTTGRPGEQHRWSPFGDPPVPTWYGAISPMAALAETVFRDYLAGAPIGSSQFRDRMLSPVTLTSSIILANFAGSGLQRFGLTSDQLTATPAEYYPDTIAWACAAYEDSDVAGLTWMAHRWNTDRAFVLFGDRITSPALRHDPRHPENRSFALIPDVEWLASEADRFDALIDLG